MGIFSDMPLGLVAEKPAILAGAVFVAWEDARETIDADNAAIPCRARALSSLKEIRAKERFGRAIWPPRSIGDMGF